MILKKLIRTENSWALFVARIVLGVAILPHGLQKTLGYFGGTGFSTTYGFFTQKLGFPAIVALLVILGESLGAISLILGLFGRISAFGIVLIMLGAIFMVHAQNGFFMNWMNNQQGEGFEYHLLAI